MKIGSAVVADWSHNGRCNIWERPDEKGAPSLHRTSYSRNDLRKDLPRSLDEVERNSSGVYTHSGAAGYLWQNKTRDIFIALQAFALPPPLTEHADGDWLSIACRAGRR